MVLAIVAARCATAAAMSFAFAAAAAPYDSTSFFPPSNAFLPSSTKLRPASNAPRARSPTPVTMSRMLPESSPDMIELMPIIASPAASAFSPIFPSPDPTLSPIFRPDLSMSSAPE